MLRGIYRNLDKFYHSSLSNEFHYFRYKDIVIHITFGVLGNYYNLYYNKDCRNIAIKLNTFEKIYFRFICKRLLRIQQKKYRNKIRKEITY